MQITGEVLAGAGTSFTLAFNPVPNEVAVYGGGIRINIGTGDFSIAGQVITILNGSYSAGQVTADYTTLTTTSTASGNDVLSPYALTTLQRCKDLLFDPNSTILVTGCTITATSNSISGAVIPTTKTVRVGQQISGWGIPAGTTILAISGSTLVISAVATISNTGQTVTVIDQTPQYDGMLTRMINSCTRYITNECGRTSFVQATYVHDTYSIDKPTQSYLYLRNTPVYSLTVLEWRAGTPTNPSWTAFIPDQFEMVDPRTDPTSGLTWYPSGIVRVYGVLPRIYNNMIRATYVGGYPVNWANAGDESTHLLPADLTNLCENLVVRRFKRRALAGQSSMTLDGATIGNWRDKLDAEDLDVIGQYRQVNF